MRLEGNNAALPISSSEIPKKNIAAPVVLPLPTTPFG